jgi:hypothetical protein
MILLLILLLFVAAFIVPFINKGDKKLFRNLNRIIWASTGLFIGSLVFSFLLESLLGESVSSALKLFFLIAMGVGTLYKIFRLITLGNESIKDDDILDKPF